MCLRGHAHTHARELQEHGGAAVARAQRAQPNAAHVPTSPTPADPPTHPHAHTPVQLVAVVEPLLAEAAQRVALEARLCQRPRVVARAHVAVQVGLAVQHLLAHKHLCVRARVCVCACLNACLRGMGGGGESAEDARAHGAGWCLAPAHSHGGERGLPAPTASARIPPTLRPLTHRSQKCSLCDSSRRRLSAASVLKLAPFTSGCVKLHRPLLACTLCVCVCVWGGGGCKCACERVVVRVQRWWPCNSTAAAMYCLRCKKKKHAQLPHAHARNWLT
jgi:hypothetical protein